MSAADPRRVVVLTDDDVANIDAIHRGQPGTDEQTVRQALRFYREALSHVRDDHGKILFTRGLIHIEQITLPQADQRSR